MPKRVDGAGFYEGRWTKERQASFRAALGVHGLEQEIALLRVMLVALLHPW